MLPVDVAVKEVLAESPNRAKLGKKKRSNLFLWTVAVVSAGVVCLAVWYLVESRKSQGRSADSKADTADPKQERGASSLPSRQAFTNMVWGKDESEVRRTLGPPDRATGDGARGTSYYYGNVAISPSGRLEGAWITFDHGKFVAVGYK